METDRERLAGMEDRYHELFSWAPLGYALLASNGLICEMNYTGADLLEVGIDEIIAQPFIGYVTKADRATFARHLAHARQSSETVEDEVELRSAGGHQFPVRLCTRRSPRREQGMCWTIFDDLTDERRLTDARCLVEDPEQNAENQHRLTRLQNNAKDRFVAALSHELRTPLTPVLMATSMLSGLKGLPPSAATMIDTIRRNVEIEARLIDNLLDITQLSRHTMRLDRRHVDAHGLLRDAIALAAPEARAKGLDISLQAGAPEARIHADPLRLRQAFQQLLDNAVKFTPSGHIVVMTENDEPRVLRVAISDTGVGMASETLEGLFLPLEPRPSHGAEFGLGLGLSLCHGIIEAHGGRMAAASPGPGRGATLEVHLPTLAAGAPRAPEPPAGDRDRDRDDRAQPLSPARPLRILVVEDHTDSGAMLDLLLTSRGHHVAVANSVSSALARKDDRWDVVISDLGLPDGSGLDVGRGMRDLSHRPRLIALSGYGRPADLAASQEAGFDIHLVKPLEPDRLFAVLEP